jgi:hypothetical protein
VGLGIGAVFGVLAVSRKAASDREGCLPNNHCPPDAAATRDDARSLASVSTVAFIVGGTLASVGAVLWLTAPRSSVQVGVNGARWEGRF